MAIRSAQASSSSSGPSMTPSRTAPIISRIRSSARVSGRTSPASAASRSRSSNAVKPTAKRASRAWWRAGCEVNSASRPGQRGRGLGRQERVPGAGHDADQVGAQVVAEPHVGEQLVGEGCLVDEVGERGPAPVEGGLRRPGAAGDGGDGEPRVAHLDQQLAGGRQRGPLDAGIARPAGAALCVVVRGRHFGAFPYYVTESNVIRHAGTEQSSPGRRSCWTTSPSRGSARRGRSCLATMESIAELCPLDSATIHAQASAELGLDDFGPQDYRERMDLLLDCYRVAAPPVAGRPGRPLRAVRPAAEEPAAADRPDPARAGGPRRRAGAAGGDRRAAAHRHQPPAAAARRRPAVPDAAVLGEPRTVPAAGRAGRRARASDRPHDRRDGRMHTTVPYLTLMHEMEGPEHVHEEIALLANDFSTMYFETLTDVPRWVDHYRTHSQVPHYAYLRLQLQALRTGRQQSSRRSALAAEVPPAPRAAAGPRRGLPRRDRGGHAPRPRACRHVARDDGAYIERMFRSAPLDPHATGRRWADRLGEMLDALLRDRDVLGPDTSIDLPFDDFIADQEGALERVLALAGEEFTARRSGRRGGVPRRSRARPPRHHRLPTGERGARSGRAADAVRAVHRAVSQPGTVENV